MTKSTTTLRLDQLVPLWQISLKARNLSPRSVADYAKAIDRLDRWLAAEGRPAAVGDISNRTLEAWIVSLQETITRSGTPMKASAVASYYRWAQQFFVWAAKEGELGRRPSPMADMVPPAIPEDYPPAVSSAEVAALLATTARGDRFEHRRDAAIICLFYDTGIRLDELTHMGVADLDLNEATVTVMGKGRKERTVGVGSHCAEALARYWRARLRQPGTAELGALWVRRIHGSAAPLASQAIASMIGRRSHQAGIRHITPHQFRHGWASNMKLANIQLDEFKAAGGWASNVMPERYGRATVKTRAVETMKRLSPLDADRRQGR